MSDYAFRVQVLLDVKLLKELESFKNKYGYIADSVAIREALKIAFNTVGITDGKEEKL